MPPPDPATTGQFGPYPGQQGSFGGQQGGFGGQQFGGQQGAFGSPPPPLPQEPPFGGPGPAGPPPPTNPFGMGPAWAPPPGGPPPAPAPRRSPRTGTLAALAVTIALVAGVAGSYGTYLLQSRGSGLDPGYAIPSAPAGTTARPPESVAGVAARVLPSVVSLEVRGNAESGTGSGFLIKGGYVVTNNHVVAVAAQGGEIRIKFANRQATTARIVGRDPNSDIAVVKPDETFGSPEAALGNSDTMVVGDPVIAIGSPLGLTGTVTTGIVSSLNRPVEAGGERGRDSALINAIQTDAAINPGNSGGPLVNAAGEVIGVNSAIATLGGGSALGGQQTGSIGLGFAIPVNQVRRIAEELITTGTARTSRIGISIDQQYQGPGVRIAAQAERGIEPVTPGGPADKAGLRPGDVILEVAGQPVGDSRELIVTIRSKAPGDQVSFKYQRAGAERTTTVTIGAAPAPSARPS
ncbi:S1C family serine protease [Acrocarpospora catenulata]|uniref:S1C family serine protease n=1 Tax=Acrocarpospora catenulata TaxID=2836182 RepID=UPI001BDB5C58|nr:trypsin-like peptidase domain-containing protein [Acrocarpospora catenulata]